MVQTHDSGVPIEADAALFGPGQDRVEKMPPHADNHWPTLAGPPIEHTPRPCAAVEGPSENLHWQFMA
jgi:hypothetical protein